jgi:hypothetical protein
VPGCEADGNVRWSDRRALKDIEPGPAPEMLPAVRALEVEHWRYRPAVAEALGLDQAEHIGPMAEDWQAATGLGDGVTINVIDAIGVLTKAVQELAAEVAELKKARTFPKNFQRKPRASWGGALAAGCGRRGDLAQISRIPSARA